MERTDNLTVLFTIPCASTAKSLLSSESLEDIIREGNIVDYDSETVVEEGETREPATSASCEPSRIAPNPFPERSTAQTLTELRASTTLDEPIVTNDLDKQQQRYIEENERARRLSRIEYRRSLAHKRADNSMSESSNSSLPRARIKATHFSALALAVRIKSLTDDDSVVT